MARHSGAAVRRSARRRASPRAAIAPGASWGNVTAPQAGAVIGFSQREARMRKVLLAVLLLALPHPALADGPYRILKTVTVGGDGGFDYIVADAAGRRLYIARSGKTNPRLLAFDLDSLKQAGALDGISAHGAVVDPANHHGFASSKPLTMFDSSSMATLKSIAVDGNTDGLSLDVAAHRVYVLSHIAPNTTANDTRDGSTLGTVNLD